MAHPTAVQGSQQWMSQFALHPPYTEFSAQNGKGPADRALPAGVLLAIRPHYGAGEAEVVQAIDAVYRSSPRTTVILWLDLAGRDAAVRLAAAASARGVRGIVPNRARDPVRLRADLTDAGWLPEDVVRWLEMRDHALRPALREITLAAIRFAGECRNLTELAQRTGGSADAWRTAIQHAGLGAPQNFHQILRLLTIGVRIQHSPDRPIEQIALECAYHDAAALRRRFGTVFGHSPSDVRARLGWQWMLDTALRRTIGGAGR